MILNNMLPDINTQVVFDGTAYLIYVQSVFDYGYYIRNIIYLTIYMLIYFGLEL